ncbi:MAG TPA: hypothetical protein VG838_00505 [Opitutaceae bacterium]|nr:hypothetical protein [Opitutaceae bacterium]
MSEDRLKRIEEAVARIEQGLFGDEELDQWGLVRRVGNHGKRIKRLELLAIYLSSGSVIAGVLYKVATDWWPHK